MNNVTTYTYIREKERNNVIKTIACIYTRCISYAISNIVPAQVGSGAA